MHYSSSLTDKEWEIIEPLLPKKKRTKPATFGTIRKPCCRGEAASRRVALLDFSSMADLQTWLNDGHGA